MKRRWIILLALVAMVAIFLSIPGLADNTLTLVMLQANGIPPPLKIGRNYTIADPTLAPSAASNATASACSSVNKRLYLAFANLSGITNLSPYIEITPTAFKQIVVTRTETVPASATGWLVYWSSSADGFAAKRLCSVSSADAQLNAPGTTTFACGCGAGASAPTSNGTGYRSTYSVDVLGTNVVGFGSVGSTIGSVTDGVRRLRGTGPLLEYSSDSGTSYSSLVVNSATNVSVCASGCQYTTVNAACAAVTSTAALPVTINVGPGAYSGQISCSGQDHLTIQGSGIGTTILTYPTGGAGNYGTLQFGTSTNWTVRDFTVVGHRSIWQDAQSIGGGTITIQGMEFTTIGLDQDEDCVFLHGPFVANTKVRAIGNFCTRGSDGFTVDYSPNMASFVSKANTFYAGAQPNTNAFGGNAFSMIGIPCVFVSQGDNQYYITPARTGSGGGGNTMYSFSVVTNGGTSCSNAVAWIQDAQGFHKIPFAEGFTTSTGIDIGAGAEAAKLAELHLRGVELTQIVSDVTNGSTYGIFVRNSTTHVYLDGVRLRDTGGSQNRDIDSPTGAQIHPTTTVDYVTYHSSDGILPATLQTPNHQRGTCTFAAAATCTVTLPTALFSTAGGITLGCHANIQPYISAQSATQFTITSGAGATSTSCDWVFSQ